MPSATAGVGRRRILGAAGGTAGLALAPLLGGSGPAEADVSRSPDVVVFCDPTLRPCLAHLGQSFRRQGGASLAVICAPAGIIAAQLARGERNDVVITLEPVLARLQAAQLVEGQTAIGAWRNRVTIAGPEPNLTAPSTPDQLSAQLQDGKLGAPDPSANAVFDTPELLRQLGLQALAGQIVGEIDTGGVSFLLSRGTVRFGLVLRTDARAHSFGEAAVPDDAYPPIRYRTARNRHAMSRNTTNFLRFLASASAREIVVTSGLEVLA